MLFPPVILHTFALIHSYCVFECCLNRQLLVSDDCDGCWDVCGGPILTNAEVAMEEEELDDFTDGAGEQEELGSSELGHFEDGAFGEPEPNLLGNI